MARPRKPSWLPALVVSLGAHLLLAWGAGRSAPVQLAAAPPAEPPRPPVRFELVDTDPTARVDEAPETARIAEHAARAQDRAREESPLGDPRAPIVADDRPRAAAPATAPAPASPAGSAPPAPEVPSRADGTVSAPAPRREPTAAEPPRPPAPPATPARPATPAEAEELTRAAAAGEFSYEATQHFFAEYLRHLRQAVESQWILGLTARYRGRTTQQAVVEFTVLPDGRIGDLALRSMGDEELFAAISVQAIRAAAPFGPVPYDRLPRAEVPTEELPLRIRFTFDYR